jgi:signal peptidase
MSLFGFIQFSGRGARVMGRVKEALGAAGNLVLMLLVILAAFLAYGNLNNRWYRVLVVNSGSMAPTFNAGDLIVIVRSPEPEELQPGMIVTFQTKEGDVVTHRIVRIEPEGYIKTKGDANEGIDHWIGQDGQEYQILRVAGLYIGRIPLLGRILRFLMTLWPARTSAAMGTSAGM